MGNAVKVAVVVVNYNAGHYLEKCLSKLQEQTLSPEKIIVVDNASSDGSALDLKEKFSGIDWLFLDENIGFAAANNLAVSKVEDCTWVVFLNPDAFAHADWLQKLVQASEDHKEYALFGSQMLRHGNLDEYDGTGDVYHVSGLAWRRDHGAEVSSIRRSSGEIFSPCAAASMVKRSVFVEAGGFDEDFFCYMEDVDLGFRLRLMGERSFHVAEAIVEHVGSATTHRNSDFAVFHGNRNLVWTYFKNMPGILLWVYLPQHLLANVAALCWFSLRGQMSIIFKAKWSAVKGLPEILKKRQQIQKNNSDSLRNLTKVFAKGLLKPYFRK